LNSRQGIGTQIGIFILGLLAFGVLYAALNQGVSLMETFQTTNFGSGVFNPVDYLTFAEQAWIWFPLMVLFSAVFWLLRQAQRRSNPGEDFVE